MCDFATPWIAVCQASLSFTISQSLLKLMYIEAVMPSNHFILWQPLLPLPLIFPSFRIFSNESVLHIRWPKYWSFSFSISSSNEYSGLISLQSKRLSKPSPLQHHHNHEKFLYCIFPSDQWRFLAPFLCIYWPKKNSFFTSTSQVVPGKSPKYVALLCLLWAKYEDWLTCLLILVHTA